jgi:hypothetical protein
MDTVEDARDYVAGHPEVFGGLRVSGELVIVAFTSHLDEHLRGLRASVEHPELVRVELAQHPRTKLEADAREIRQRLANDPRRPLQGNGPGQVRLRAPFESLAADLHREFGASLQITVGFKPFPPEHIVDPQPVPLPVPTLVMPGLALTIVTDSFRVVQGEDLRGHVVFHNRGSTDMADTTGGLLVGAVRADHDDDCIAGAHAGAIAWVGRHIQLSPGASTEVPLLIGTASRLPDTSYVVPPGRYEIIVAVGYRQLVPTPEGRPLLVARGAWITVEARTTDE